MGSGPGVRTSTRGPSAMRLAAMPARRTEDLPHPDGPTSATTPAASSRRRQAVTSAPRPKKASQSSASKAASPG